MRRGATASRAAGGWAFLADPAVRADRQSVFWRPELDAATVLLNPCPPDHAGDAIVYVPDAWPGETTVRAAEDGVYLLVAAGRTEHRAWLAELPPVGTPLAAHLPLNPSMPMRVEATQRFWRHVAATRLPPGRLDSLPARLTAALRALDGRLGDASYREIATALFGPERLAREPWKTASVRDATIRLVRKGLGLMRGGYRSLLGPRHRA